MRKILLLALLLFITSCSVVEPITENTVYTTFYAMYDFTKEIAGDKMNVVQLVPSGSDAHDFEPTASDIAKITKAKALIYCDGLDTYIDGIKETAQKAGVETLNTADGIITDGTDPHIWLSPENALIQYTAITELLSQIDNPNSSYYQERLELVKERINKLNDTINELCENAKKKDIIVSHGAYSYLCSDLNITEHSIEGITGDSDPTAKQMAKIIELAREKDINTVFAQNGHSNKTALAVANELGIQALYLDPFESDTGNGNYFEVMEKNLDAIAKAIN